jgi:mannose-1-phosphate guanylyltransferase
MTASDEAMTANHEETWAIILAAGQGQRLARLTRALYGREVPKQFAALDGEQTFLQQTITRAKRLTPPERMVVVVAEEHGALAREQLAPFGRIKVVEQPRNVGTLPGLLLPLAHVLDEAPRARVVVYPADHHVQRFGPFIDAVERAISAVDHAPGRTVLVGARADRAATDLGWIMPGRTLSAAGDKVDRTDQKVRSVETFIEKPPATTAARLHEAGALWNTLLIALDGATFWDGALEAHPLLAQSFQRYRSGVRTTNEALVRREIYERLPTLDLSRDLLERWAGLAVVEMADAGWSDCGTPERLFECLAGSGGLGMLLGRLGASSIETQI